MDRIQNIKEHIAPIVALTDQEFSTFFSAFETKRLAKNQFFLREGQICNFVGFVSKGALVYFKSMPNGNEMTTDFGFEGDWVTVNQSRLNNSPSTIQIKAIEKTELLVVSQQTLSEMYLRIPKLERLGRILMEQAYLKIARQSIDLQVLTARERYEGMLRNYPEIFRRVPLYHIANYLGIAPKSLSRIRKELFD
jgi:CRP-like cAMP-binding protein